MSLSDNQRRLRRSKESERVLGKWLQQHDGIDPQWAPVASSTSRVGHLTGLQFDAVSPHYCGENKQVRMPIKFLSWWLQIVGIAATHGKDALLRIEPTNVLNIAGKQKRPMSMHIITEDRHAELLRAEREYEKLAEKYEKVMDSLPVSYSDMFPDDED
jgi:hypothetical protein